MKSLQESLLDDNIIDNTNIDSILMSTFPKKSIVYLSSFEQYYAWESNYFKNICKYNIDTIKVYWNNNIDIFNFLRKENLLKIKLIFANRKKNNIFFMILIDINISNIDSIDKYKEKSYNILNIIKDNIYNIDKIINYIKTHKKINLSISQQEFEDLFK